MSKETEKAVAEYLTAHGITFKADYIGQRKREGWDCDAWICGLYKGKLAETFEYFTGLGHRQYRNGVTPSIVFAGGPGTVYRERYDAGHKKPVTPPAAGVLHSLILDSSAIGQSFESWASDYGYDTDSRKAEEIYRACQRNTDKLQRILTRADLEALEALLQDY